MLSALGFSYTSHIDRLFRAMRWEHQCVWEKPYSAALMGNGFPVGERVDAVELMEACTRIACRLTYSKDICVWADMDTSYVFLSSDGKTAAIERQKETGESLREAIFRYWFANSKVLEVLVQINRTDILIDPFQRCSSMLEKLHNRFNSDNTFDYFSGIVSSVMISIMTTWVRHGKIESEEEAMRCVKLPSPSCFILALSDSDTQDMGNPVNAGASSFPQNPECED